MASIFGDVQTYLQNAYEDAENLKQEIQQKDDTRRAELEELRREVERERFERRDSLNKIRYEFEEFVHHKIDKIFEEVEQFKTVEEDDDSMQQLDIESISRDMDQLKEGLVDVQRSWSQLVANTLSN
eukprot:NODE_20971_length_774_cov_12.083462.p1 GENE.NODE_20971_length_774_cov_12.083462~~NODE_20971_length_774_cov_12.083462.p1  ORF type:complete len:127 (-),score=38.37 NODE_20971_length_774_cov_12.083462:291-671(-)